MRVKLLSDLAFRLNCIRFHICSVHGCAKVYYSADDTETWTWGKWCCPKCQRLKNERISELRFQLEQQIKHGKRIKAGAPPYSQKATPTAEQELKPRMKAYGVFDTSKTPAELVHRGPEQMTNGTPECLPLPVIRYEIHANEDSANNAASYWQGEEHVPHFEVRPVELHPCEAAYAVMDWMMRKPAATEEDAA